MVHRTYATSTCDISTDLVHMPVLSTTWNRDLSSVNGVLSSIHKKSNEAGQAWLDTLMHSVALLHHDPRLFGRQSFLLFSDLCIVTTTHHLSRRRASCRWLDIARMKAGRSL
jgi:hypothetical protein